MTEMLNHILDFFFYQVILLFKIPKMSEILCNSMRQDRRFISGSVSSLRDYESPITCRPCVHMVLHHAVFQTYGRTRAAGRVMMCAGEDAA